MGGYADGLVRGAVGLLKSSVRAFYAVPRCDTDRVGCFDRVD